MGTSRHKVTMVYTHPASSQQTNSYAYNNYAAKAAGGPASATWTCFQMFKSGSLMASEWPAMAKIYADIDRPLTGSSPEYKATCSSMGYTTQIANPILANGTQIRPAPSSSSKKVPYYSLRSL